jgi:hypothetical protein
MITEEKIGESIERIRGKLMVEHPILFSGEMVKAILEGRKTQTRRVVQPQPDECEAVAIGFNKAGELGAVCGCTPPGPGWIRCPYGKPGDGLWVRETFVVEIEEDGNEPPFSDGRPIKFLSEFEGETFDWAQPHYRATDPQPDLCCEHKKCEGGPCSRPWWPSIFMPRWASRITLEVVKVRVERLQDISNADARAEGVDAAPHRGPQGGPCTFETGIDQCFGCSYRFLWNVINGKRGFGWDKNPWVWVVEFKRVEGRSGR